MNQRITIGTMPNCQQCRMMERRMENAGMEFDTINLSSPQNKEILQRAKQAGYRSAPVLFTENGTPFLSGYRPDKLKELDALAEEADTNITPATVQPEPEPAQRAEQVANKIEKILDEIDANFGNTELYVEGDTVYYSIESPQNTTLSIATLLADFEDAQTDRDYRSIVAQQIWARIEQFDIDEEFEELWSPEFGKHNSFTASRFLHLLEDSEDFFTQLQDAIMDNTWQDGGGRLADHIQKKLIAKQQTPAPSRPPAPLPEPPVPAAITL